MKKKTRNFLIFLCIVCCLITGTLSILSIVSAFDFLEFIPEKAATCTEAGHISYYRDRRGGLPYIDANGENMIDVDRLTLPPLGHSLEFVPATDATCEKDGNEEYWHCTRQGCGKYFSDAYGNEEINKDETIREKGHSYNATSTLGKWEWQKDYSAARLKFTCAICNEPQVIQASVEIIETKEPTCEEIGFKIYKATVSIGGTSYTDIQECKIPAKGHRFDVNNKCKDCGYSIQYTQGLDYDLNADDTYTVFGVGAAPDGDIVIPYYHNGKLVTAIRSHAFCPTYESEIDSITSITIPSSVLPYRVVMKKYICYTDR